MSEFWKQAWIIYSCVLYWEI